MLRWIGVIQPSQPKRLLRRSGLVLASALALAIYGLRLYALAALGADI